MTSPPLTQPEQRIQLSGISWQTYENLLAELFAHRRRVRLIYNRGNLEIMVPSPEGERYKKILARFVETIAEEVELKIEALGSTTLQRSKLSGAEPDECFYIQNQQAIQGKKKTRSKARSAAGFSCRN